MGFSTVNVNQVKLEVTNHGNTKTLHSTAVREEPTIQLRLWGPNTNIPVHKHPFNEMFYVLEGEVEMGDTAYPVGSCIFISKGTEYGPTRSPKGCTVLRYAEGKST